MAGDELAVSTLAEALLEQLRKPPFFVVLSGLRPTKGRALVSALMRAIAATPPVTAPLDRSGRLRLSFARVHLDPSKTAAAEGRSNTSYSRTNGPLALHTDSSYRESPHELIAFQMVRSACWGGETLIATGREVIESLDEEHRRSLRRPVFPLGKTKRAVLEQTGSSVTLRYYRAQLEASSRSSAPLDGPEDAALRALDASLSLEAFQYRFPLASGEVVFINNRRALHGRAAFPADSDRLLLRYRINAGCLAV